MGNLTYTAARATHPRVFFRDTDIATFRTRAARANGWGALWPRLVSDVTSSATGMVKWTEGYATSDGLPQYIKDYYYHYLAMRMIFAGYVDLDASHEVRLDVFRTWNGSWRSALKSWAVKWCEAQPAYPATPTYTGGQDGIRSRCQMLALVFDCCFDLMNDAQKKTIGEMAWRFGNLSSLTGGGFPQNELLDGHPTNNICCAIAPMLAIHGHSGTGYDFTAGTYDASVTLGKCLDFFWGGNTLITSDRADVGTGWPRLSAERFFCSTGGSYKGPYYCEAHHGLYFYSLRWVYNALTEVKLNGTDYNPLTDESWLPKMREWLCHLLVRGDNDFVKIGDSWRGTSPVFHPHLRAYIGHIHNAQSDSAGRQTAMYAYRYWQAYCAASSQVDSLYWVVSFMFHDIDPAIEPVGTPEGNVLKTKLWDPPGIFIHKQSWDYPNTCWIMMNLAGWYYLGHQDLDRGQIQCYLDGSMLCCDSGMYQTDYAGGVPNTAYDYEHSNFWRKQSISKSGIVLVDDGSSTPHRTYNQDPEIGTPGNRYSYPSGLGGQYFKELLDGGNYYLDPMTTENALADGSGLAWRACMGETTDSSATKLGEDARVFVLYTNLRRAYLKLHTDYGGGAERVRRYERKAILIKNIDSLGQPALFFLDRVESRLSTMSKRQVWNFWDIVSISTVGDGLRILARGYIPNTPTPAYQRYIAVEVYNPSYWNVTTVGGGAGPDLPQGPHDFEYGGVNRAPRAPDNSLLPIGARHLNDIHRIRAEVAPKVAATEDYYPTLLIPHRSNQTIPSIRWINETNWFGIEIEGLVYKLHKTLNQYVSPLGAPDTEPPPAPTNLAGTTPESQQVGLTWDPVVVTDLSKYRAYKRVKV